jgi:ribosomal protein S18 acetylase RimI-like enzyme
MQIWTGRAGTPLVPSGLGPTSNRGTAAVRAGRLSEESRVVDVIVSAFEADPAARWMYPDVAQYRVYFPEFIRSFGGRAFASGTAHVVENFAGAALWLPPGVHPHDEAVMSLVIRTTSEDLQGQLMSVFEEMGSYHPLGLHWHLPLIGVHPAFQRQGHGAALLRHALQICDEQGAAAYLESSNPENIPLYERYGFEVLGRIQVGSSPVITPMLRCAR